MKRAKPVSNIVNGVVVRKIAYRDLTQYPDTDAGDAALLADIKAGLVPLVDRPADVRILGFVGGRINETRTDSGGRLFISAKAPTFTSRVLPFPPEAGISIPIVEQTARGIVNFDRFEAIPPLRDRKVHVFGPWYNDAAYNKHFDHGITSINLWGLYANGPTNIYNALTYDKKMQFFGDDVIWASAGILATDKPTSPYVATWRQIHDNHVFVTGDPGAWSEIGKNIWGYAQAISTGTYAPAGDNKGLKYISLDMESTNQSQFARECIGNIYEGFCQAAAAAGVAAIPLTYGQNNFYIQIFDDSLKQANTGFPEYLKDYKDLFPSVDKTIQVLNTYGGAMTNDGYFQRIWGNDPLLKRDTAGTVLVSGGKPVYNDIQSMQAYGQTIPLETGVVNGVTTGIEAAGFIHDFYRHAGRQFLQLKNLANDYPATEGQRRAGYEGVTTGAYTRITNEGVLGMPYNDRPLPYWMLKTIQMMNLFDSYHVVQWGDDFNQTPLAPGAASPRWQYNAGGTVEAMVDAVHDYAYYDAFHVGDPKRAWWNLDVVSSNNIDGEYPWQKPVLRTKIRAIGGKQYIEVFGAWPLLDNTAMVGKLWFTKNGKTSKAYTVTIPSGRQYHYSMFEVPGDTEFVGLDGGDLRFRFTDILGVVRTWIGDYRLFPSFDGSIATPADYDTGAAVVVPPAPTAVALGFGAITYDATANKLLVVVNNAVGTPNFTIVGQGINLTQPIDGFILNNNTAGTLVTIRVKTATQAEIEIKKDTTHSDATPAPTNGGPLNFGAITYDSATKKLLVVVNNAVGTPSFTIVGQGIDLTQPTDGFVLNSNTAGSLVTIRVKTVTQAEIETKKDTATTTGGGGGTTPAPAPVIPPAASSTDAYLQMPDSGIAIYNQNTNPRDYGGGAEDRSQYEYQAVRYVENNDGITAPTVNPQKPNQKYLLPYMGLLDAVATNNGQRTKTEKVGGYINILHSHAKVGLNQQSVWATGGLSPSWKRQMANQFGEAARLGQSYGVGVTLAREGGFSEFITDADRTVDRQGGVSNFDVRGPALRQYRRLLAAGFDVNTINTTSTAGKFLADLKLMCAELKQYFGPNKPLTFFMPGLRNNGEVGYDGTQDSPDTSWGDWHPDEIFDLQQYLKGVYGNNLSALNAAWGTGFANWSDVTLPYTGNLGDFKGRRGIDCNRFRQITVADTLELYARVVWSEMPGLPIIVNKGQGFGGQAGIVATVQNVYDLERLKAVRVSLGITTRCIGNKCNPEGGVNSRIRARYKAYEANQALGYVITAQELSYEPSPSQGEPEMTALSNQFREYRRAGNTGQSGGNKTMNFAVLFSAAQWGKAGGVADMLGRYYNFTDLNTPRYAGFNSADGAHTINILVSDILRRMGPDEYPFMAQLEQDMTALGEATQDIKLVFESLV